MTLFRVQQKHLPKNPKIHFRSITSLFLSFPCVSIQPRNINFSFSALLLFHRLFVLKLKQRNRNSGQCCIQIFLCVFRAHTPHFYFHFFVSIQLCMRMCVCFYLVNFTYRYDLSLAHTPCMSSPIAKLSYSN